VLCTDGCFCGRGTFRGAPKFHLRDLEALFRHKVLRMLLARGKINCDLIRMMESWRHSGFNVYAGPRIHPRQKRSLENLAAYLIRSSFSQQRMTDLRRPRSPTAVCGRHRHAIPRDRGCRGTSQQGVWTP